MLVIRRCPRLTHTHVWTRRYSPRRLASSQTKHSPLVDTDSHGIPTQPVWSVNELLSSYPKPTISAATLKHLHQLSALIPPEEGTPKHAELTAEMEDLVKLVEAVKLVDVGQSLELNSEVPDGRIWAEGTGIQLQHDRQHNGSATDDKEIHGQALLSYASRTENSFYVVDADRKR